MFFKELYQFSWERCLCRETHPEPSVDHEHPQTPGITKVLFFKAAPVHLLPSVCGCGSREAGKLLRPCSTCTPLPVACLLRGQPFEGVITAACITWVTADGGWSQLMKPLKKLRRSWFLLRLWRTGARPGSQTHTHRDRGCLTFSRPCILTYDG